MTDEKMVKSKPTVAVLGATGHTGRFVVAELIRRRITPIAIARNSATLEKASFPDEVLCRSATVDDARSLDRVLEGARAVINCAGPFVDTVDAIAGAALRAKIHYIDVSAEQTNVSSTLEKFDVAARQAGVVVLPSIAFFGGFADLLVKATLSDWDAVDTIEIMIGLDFWHPTPGTRNTIKRNTGQRNVIAGGRLTPLPTPLPQKHWNFGDPLGDQLLVEVPFTEVILVPRHVKTTELHNYLSELAVREVRDPATPGPKAMDDAGRSAQHFAVDVVIARGRERRRSIARGRDIYAFTAPLVCEVAERLLEGRFENPGAHAPSEILDARDVLEALVPNHLSFEIIAV